jgi:hypothetical protein
MNINKFVDYKGIKIKKAASRAALLLLNFPYPAKASAPLTISKISLVIEA